MGTNRIATIKLIDGRVINTISLNTSRIKEFVEEINNSANVTGIIEKYRVAVII